MTTDTWTEPLVLRLIKRHRGKDPKAVIESYAQRLLTDAQQAQFPIDVDLIASVQGVRRRLGEHDFAGRIYVEADGQLVMDLNTSHNSNRQRFTCAHEMMHTAFPGFEREGRYRLDSVVESNPRNREEEYLCDLGAAALLMPRALVVGEYSLEGGLRAVEALSRDAEASLEAAGNRLAELSDTPALFMTFEFGHKPADEPALRRGEAVEKRVRLRYARAAQPSVYLPRFKGADPDSAIARAYESDRIESGTETLPGAEAAGLFEVEAKCYGAGERERVLAVARPAYSTPFSSGG